MVDIQNEELKKEVREIDEQYYQWVLENVNKGSFKYIEYEDSYIAYAVFSMLGKNIISVMSMYVLKRARSIKKFIFLINEVERLAKKWKCDKIEVAAEDKYHSKAEVFLKFLLRKGYKFRSLIKEV